MAFLDTLALRLAPAIAGPLFSAWSRRRGKTPENTRTLRELIASATRNGRAIPKLEGKSGGSLKRLLTLANQSFKLMGRI
jgi:hypothetical protein